MMTHYIQEEHILVYWCDNINLSLFSGTWMFSDSFRQFFYSLEHHTASREVFSCK